MRHTGDTARDGQAGIEGTLSLAGQAVRTGRRGGAKTLGSQYVGINGVSGVSGTKLDSRF